MKKIDSKIYIGSIASVLVGLFVGWLIFAPSGTEQQEKPIAEEGVHEYTCSMHPQVRQNAPGKCPLCGMDLVLAVSNSEVGVDEFTVRMSETAQKIAEVSTYRVKARSGEKFLELSGKVKEDERRISGITARFEGRIESMNVNFTGQKVSKGQILATVYSPALISAQQELLQAVQYRETSPVIYETARKKLLLWGLSEGQVNRIETEGKVRNVVEIEAPVSGTVTARNVVAGEYVKEGMSLFEISNLNAVWVVFDAYESDLNSLKTGQLVKFSVKTFPGREFSSRIAFIDPVIDPVTRVVGVRADFNNSKGELKPEMLVMGQVETGGGNSETTLMIPESSVLWTGKKAIVYVRNPDDSELFTYREVKLGSEQGEFREVLQGLEEGEEIAAYGVFRIDAAAQLAGKVSMMNQPDNQPENEYVPDRFRDQLNEIAQAYVTLKDALVASDFDEAKLALKAIIVASDNVDRTELDEATQRKWQEDLRILKKGMSGLKESKDLDDLRLNFAPFSKNVYEVVKRFGVGQQMYYQYCPMALKNQGAYWLSYEEEVLNPYYGKMMLRCGEVVEELK